MSEPDTTAIPTGGAARTLNALLAERDLLLRSIRDLRAEHAAGELSDERYRMLLDSYTVQAATVLRAIDRVQITDQMDDRPGRRRPVLAAVGIVGALMIVGGALLVRSLGDRSPGQTITGNAQSVAPDLAVLQRSADGRPNDASAQLDYAHALLRAGRTVDALKVFDAAARLDPRNPEPRAYGGWIVFLAGLPDEALSRLDAAVAIDPSYPDARFFRGMVLRGRGDTPGALLELREFVRLAPPGAERDQVRGLITQMEGPSSTSTTSAAP